MSTHADQLVESRVPQAKTLENLRKVIRGALHVPPEDEELIDFILAVYVSNQIPGDPLWGLIVDASGGGKTELLRTLRNRRDAYFLSGLTEKSLVSGYRDQRNPSNDPSLLPQLDGKVLIIKDLSPLLSMRRETRNTILGDLRDAYDGFTDHGRSNLGRVSYRARFSVLAASTLAVERFSAVEQELGERFVKFRARGEENSAKVRQAIRNLGNDDELRVQLEKEVSGFLDSLPPCPDELRLSGKFEQQLVEISDFAATARSHVPRDRQHNLLYSPRPEVGTRLGKELANLAVALAHIRGAKRPGKAELRTVARVAEDCLPPNRLAVLRALRATAQPGGVHGLAQAAGLPESTARQTLEDLEVLGLAARAENSLWQMPPEWSERCASLPILR
jgi:hypothetical protein